MRYFRRFPPFLRVVSVMGLLLPIASLAILVSAMIAKILSIALSVPLALWDASHITEVTVNLGTLGGACIFVVNTYRARFYQPDRTPVLLNSWQSQARTLALLAALPLCALVLTLITPLDDLAYLLVMALSMLAVIMTLVAYAGGINSAMASSPLRSPQAP